MDFPISVPGIGLVGGKFVDENQLTGTPGSLIPAQWGNGVTEEILNVISAAGLAPSEALNNQLLAAIRGLTAGRLINIRVFTASGTYTPTAGATSAIVELVGGGGGGGGAPATSSAQVGIGAGGASGSYGKRRISSGLTTTTVTVGLGGTSGTGGTPGGTGGTSSFGALLSATGGNGGNPAGPSAPPLNNGTNNTGASVIGANIIGVVSQVPPIAFASSLNVGYSGAGAPGLLGAGAPLTNISQAGNAAGNYGGGGSGALSLASASAANGGAGAPGIVIIYEYA